MKIKIREVKIGNNLISVMFDKHHNGVRTQSRPGIKYADVPRTATERQDKKEKKELIRKMVAQMELDSHYSDFSIDRSYDMKKDFFEFCQSFIERKAPISDVRTYKAVLNKLKLWSKKDKLICGTITESMLIEFKDHLSAKMNGISANNYFKKLKRFFKEATIAKHFRKNPIEEIINVKGRSAPKDILTAQEVKRLADTPCSNSNVKRAFLFCCFVGIRHCDTIRLRWENIKEGYIDIIQLKTQERLIVKLHDDAIYLIGDKKHPADLVFKLPTHTGCLKILKKWVADAGIEKHITWHCARHSFATSLLNEDVDVFTVSKLLGHKKMMQTQDYLRISESKKQMAVNKLPSIF